MKDNVYVTFTYENSEGGSRDIVFDDITKRVPILTNPSDYEVGVTRAYLRVSSSGPATGEFTRVVIMSNSIGVREEFSNNIQNDLQPIISSFQYGTVGSSTSSYPAGFLQFPGEYNSEVHYVDIENSNPLYRLDISMKAHMKDDTYRYFTAISNINCGSITLHFRRKK